MPTAIEERALNESTLDTLNKLLNKEIPVAVYQENRDAIKKDYGVDVEAVDYILQQKGLAAPQSNAIQKTGELIKSGLETAGKAINRAAETNVAAITPIIKGALEIPKKIAPKPQPQPTPEVKPSSTSNVVIPAEIGVPKPGSRPFGMRENLTAGIQHFPKQIKEEYQSGQLLANVMDALATGWGRGISANTLPIEKTPGEHLHPWLGFGGNVAGSLMALKGLEGMYSPLGTKAMEMTSKWPVLSRFVGQAATAGPAFGTYGAAQAAGQKKPPAEIAKTFLTDSFTGAVWGATSLLPSRTVRMATMAAYGAAEDYAKGERDPYNIALNSSIMALFAGISNPKDVENRAYQMARRQTEKSMAKIFVEKGMDPEAANQQANTMVSYMTEEYFKKFKEAPTFKNYDDVTGFLEKVKSITKSGPKGGAKTLLLNAFNPADVDYTAKVAGPSISQVQGAIAGTKFTPDTKVVGEQTLNDLAAKIIKGDSSVVKDLQLAADEMGEPLIRHNISNLVEGKLGEMAAGKGPAGYAEAQKGMAKVHEAILKAMEGGYNTENVSEIARLAGETLRVAPRPAAPKLPEGFAPAKEFYHGEEVAARTPEGQITGVFHSEEKPPYVWVETKEGKKYPFDVQGPIMPEGSKPIAGSVQELTGKRLVVSPEPAGLPEASSQQNQKLTPKQKYDQGLTELTADLNDNAKKMLDDSVKSIDEDLQAAAGTGRRIITDTGEWMGIKSLRPEDIVGKPLEAGKNSLQKWSIARDRLENGFKHPLTGEIPPSVEFLAETGQVDKARKLFEQPEALKRIGFPTQEEYNYYKSAASLADRGELPSDVPEVIEAREVVNRYEKLKANLYPETAPGEINRPGSAPETISQKPAPPAGNTSTYDAVKGYTEVGDLLPRFVRRDFLNKVANDQHVYDLTQKYYQAKGITEITLYRGARPGPGNEALAESWTSDPSIAKIFGNVSSKKIPVEDILASYEVLPSAFFPKEKEFIVKSPAKAGVTASSAPPAFAGESPIPINEPTPKSQAAAKTSIQKEINATDGAKLRKEQSLASELNRKISKTYKIPEARAQRKQQIEEVRKSKIVKFLEDNLLVPIRVGKMRSRREVLGIFKPKQEVVRTRKALDLDTISHEIGHYLDQNLGIISTIDINKGRLKPAVMPFFKELKAIATKSRTDTVVDQAREGFAEYLRLYITNPKEIATRTPGFDKYFKDILKVNPEINDILDRARSDYKRWLELPSVSRILSQISINPEKPAFDMQQKLDELYTSALDELNPIKLFVKKAKELGVGPTASEDPYILARLFRGWHGKADTFLRDTTFDVNFTEKGKPLNAILGPVKDAGQLDDLRVYLVSRRSLELSGRKIFSGIYKSDASQAVAELEKKYPEFQKVANELYQYQDTLLQYAKDSGLISGQNIEKMKALNKDYVPFFRVIEEAQQRGLAGKALANAVSPVKKIKGSGREIIDPLESIVKNTYAIINAAERNRVAQSIIKLSSLNKELGQMVEPIPVPMTKVAQVDVLKEALRPALLLKYPELGKIDPNEVEMIIDIFRPSMFAPNDNVIWALNDGKKSFYKVDPDLYRGLLALDQENMGMIFKIASIPARLLRAGATLTPDFIMRNPMRDQLSAFIYSKYGYVPVVDLVSGIWSMVTGDKSYRAWRMSGGEHSMLVSLDREYLQKNLNEIMANAKEKLGDLVIHPIEALRMMSELMEAGTRIGEFKKGIAKEGLSREGITKAGYSSRGVTLDFARIGTKTKAINALIAFFNAQIQGTDKMVRAFKSHPLKTSIKALLMLTLPSILLYLANRDDPDYQEIPRWQKDLFWLVKIGDVYWRIPKPFEIAILWGTVPERVLEAIDKKEPEKVTQLFTDLNSSLYQGLLPGTLPTFMQAPIENVTNWSFFQNRPLVPYWKTNLPPSEQYGKYESPTSKAAGKALGISPAKITNMVQGYTGGLGKYALQAADLAGEKTGIYRGRPELPAQPSDIPGIKAFAVRKPTGFNSESVMKFYDRYQKAQGYKMAMKKIEDEQGPKARVDYYKSMPADVRKDLLIWDTFQNSFNQIKELSNQYDVIYESKLSPERKQALLDKINAQIVRWAKIGNTISDKVRGKK